MTKVQHINEAFSRTDSHRAFRDDLNSIFPLSVDVGRRTYQFDVWRGQQLPDRLLAFDTETELIRERNIPRLALATVYGDEGGGYLIHPEDLHRFVQQHAQAYWCCHNAVFDFWVTVRHLESFPSALESWWEIAGDGRLCCTMLLDQLIRLARIDAEPIPRGLDVVAHEYCGLKLNKNDPYRLRYGELIDLSLDAWRSVDQGFWRYACADPVATLRVCMEQVRAAEKLIQPYLGRLLPNALRRFGPLTACLQVQGAIVLDHVSRKGVCVDLKVARRLNQEIEKLVHRHMHELESLGGTEVFQRSRRTNEYILTPSGVPRRNAKLIKRRLQGIAMSSAEPVRPPKNKDGLVTDAVSFWGQYRHLDPFIGAYVDFSSQAKLMQFFARLNDTRIYPQYRPLVRTGRTSCSKPNLQQLPRDSRFRELIVAPPGSWLLQIDFSVLELRTLAQVCLRQFGRSALADLFRRGVDPHRYTAALLLGQTLGEFEQLPNSEQKTHRQRAKAVNFGVPGGLGAESLVTYAKQAFDVQLTLKEARKFRRRLITEIYPELKAYLRDRSLADLAANLRCPVAAARQAFRGRRRIEIATAVVSGINTATDDQEFDQELVGHVWSELARLNRDLGLRAELDSRRPGVDLMRKVFFGHALTVSGRLRGHVGFSQQVNTPFQSLAADGNKLALFRVMRRGYQVCGFIHDEMLVLIPDGADYDKVIARIAEDLSDAMKEFTPDIPVEATSFLADRWYKDVDEQPRDSRGRTRPFQWRVR